MQITGFKKRSIADQRGVVDFLFSLNFDSTRGNSSCGLSGSNVFQFGFSGGAIYDPVGKLVGSYQANKPLTISGQLGQSSYDYYIDNNLVALNNPTGSGVYSWVYANATGVNLDFDTVIKGKIPSYALPSSGEYLYQNYAITGNIVNLDPSRRFRIFNATVSDPSSPYFVQSFSTGDISNTGTLVLSSSLIGLSDLFVPITLDTNFGQIGFQMAISGDHFITPDIYIGVSPDTTNVINGVAKNLSAQVSNFPNSAQIGILLEFVSGVTGNIYYFKNQVSPLISESITGFISGCGQLSKNVNYLVSGLDPKTSIYETGMGTGTLTSDTICATGDVFANYHQQVFGLGQGSFTTDYLISGNALLSYNGIVPLTGAYLQGTTTNLFGTGSTPTATTGIAPYGTGRVLVYPTGSFPITGLNPSDYFSGYLSLPKVFTGTLSTSYSVLAIGWATGAARSGVVDTHFVLDFEPGYYTFSKFFSGLVSGEHTTMQNFDPAVCMSAPETASGVLTGIYYWPQAGQSVVSPYGHTGGFIDCLLVTGLPTIDFTGLPTALYDANNNIVAPHRVFLVTPNEGFLPTETSDAVLSGIQTRTRTSRVGITPSGTGRFNQTVNQCLFSGDWTESMTTFGTSYLCSPTGNYYGYIHSESEVPFSSSEPMRPNYIFFDVSGSGQRDVFLRGEAASSDVNTAVALYKEVYYASHSTGLLHQTELVSGASIKIGTGIYTFTTYTGTGAIPGNQFRSLIELRDILNFSSGSQVIGHFEIGPKYLFLTSTGSGSAFNGITLSGSRGLLFSYPYMTGAYDSGVSRWESIGENAGWQSSDGQTFDAMNNYGLTPNYVSEAALFRTVDSGNYYSVISAKTISLSEKGFVSFTFPTYTGCRNHDSFPVYIRRTEGAYGTITGVLSLHQYNGPDFATKGSDYVGDDIPFSFGPGQTGLVLYPGILDNGVFSVTQRVDLMLAAQYENSSTSAVSGASTVPAYLLNNNNPISGFDAICSGIYYGPTGSGPVLEKIIPNPLGWFGGLGDTHLFFFNDKTKNSWIESPLNIDDNSSNANLLWFYAKTADGGEYSMYYSQKDYPPIAGGKIVDTITPSSVGVIHSEFTNVNDEPYYLSDFFTVKITSQIFVDGADTYRYFSFKTQPGTGWYNCTELGGAFYYILKEAAQESPDGSATFNTVPKPFHDGISQFLQPMGKGRGAFEQPPTLGLNKELTTFDQTSKVLREWNALCGLQGLVDLGWDTTFDMPSNIFVQFPIDDNINEILSFATPCSNVTPPVGGGDCNLSYIDYPTRYSGTVDVLASREANAWSGSVNVYVYMLYITNGTPALPVNVVFSDSHGRSVTKQVTPSCCEDSSNPFALVATITINDVGPWYVS